MSEKKEKPSVARAIQNKSSARIIIIDVCSQCELYCENLSGALSEFMMLHNNLPGIPRIQLIGLFLIGENIESVIQLQYIKTNLPKILQSMRELVTLEGTHKGGKEKFEESLSNVFMEAFAQFHKLQSISDKLISSTPQLDICLFTGQYKGLIERQVASVLKDNDLSLVKKLQLVHVTSGVHSETAISSSLDSEGSHDSGTTEVLCGYVETLFMENSVLSFEQFFKTWLQDGGSEDVHLLIDFNKDDGKKYGFELKCDVVDVIVNPHNINGGQGLILQTDLDFSHPSTSISAKTKQVGKLDIYVLKPKALIKNKNVCESVLYGLPRILKPTTCWKLDWEELERNQCYFSGIRSYLHDEKLSLLLEQDGQVKGHFLLLPSANTTMLIKSIAIRDLMMPSPSGVNSTVTREEITSNIEEEMKEIPIVNDYNPFSYTCGLFNRMLQKPNSVKTNNQQWKSTTPSKRNLKDQNNPTRNAQPSKMIRPKTPGKSREPSEIFGAPKTPNKLVTTPGTDSQSSTTIRPKTPSSCKAPSEIFGAPKTPNKQFATPGAPDKFESNILNKFNLLPPDLEEPVSPSPPSSYQAPSKEPSAKYVPRFSARSKTAGSSTSWSVRPTGCNPLKSKYENVTLTSKKRKF